MPAELMGVTPVSAEPLRGPQASDQAAGVSTGLSRAAALNALASLLDYSAKIVVGLVVTPILVGGLGRSLFGAWEVLGRTVGYLSAADGRPTQALRLVVAHQQSVSNDPLKRRYVGSAMVIWLLFLPLLAAVGAAAVWLAPIMVKAPPALQGVVRLAALLLTLHFIFGALASLPEAVLRGMNLGYRRMGLQAALSVLGGLLMVGAVVGGLGLVGLAGAQLVIAVITALCFWALVRRFVPWFGVERPTRAEIAPMLGMSLWCTAGDVIARLLLASDVIVLGLVTSTTTVALYVLTAYAARIAVSLHDLVVSSVMPGVSGVIGRQEYGRAAALRLELQALTWVFFTAVGATVLLWNASFLSLWVGEGNFAGVWPNLLIVLTAVQTAFIRIDSFLIDAALRPRLRVSVAAVAACVSIGLMVVLTPALGITGMCLGILGGRLVQSFAYPLLVRGCLDSAAEAPRGAMLRPLLAMLALFAAAAYLGQDALVGGWAGWLMGASLSLGLLLGIAFLVALSRASRIAVVHRLREMAPALRAFTERLR